MFGAAVTIPKSTLEWCGLWVEVWLQAEACGGAGEGMVTPVLPSTLPIFGQGGHQEVGL